MYYYNNNLCVEGGWLYTGITFSEQMQGLPAPGGIMTFSQYQHLKRDYDIEPIRRACKNTPALYDYKRLPEQYKQKIVTKYGDPYKLVKQNVLKNTIQDDPQAKLFFKDYIKADGNYLEDTYKSEYYTNAIILNAVNSIINNLRTTRKKLGGSSVNIWENVRESINNLDRREYPHSLCYDNSRSLERVFKTYKKEGYESLISGKLCNRNTEKINDLAKVWLVVQWSNQVNRMATINQLQDAYNMKAKQEGWKPIFNFKTIYNYLYRPDVKEMWYGHRLGEQKAKEKFTFHHTTILPSMRDSVWYSDGTKLNYFYQNESGEICTCQVYEVMDAYSEVLLGYHISNKENFEAQFSAYKMAIQFAGYKPYEIGYDNQGGHKKLENGNFLTKLAHLTINKKPYNGKSKSIESAFGRFQSQFLKRDWFFTGQNIQAKRDESKANIEFIMANKSNLPTLSEIKKIYEGRRNEWNEAEHPISGKSRIETYINSLNPKAVKVEIWDMVDIFWIQRPEPVTYDASGIHFKEKGETFRYTVMGKDNLPDIEFHRKHIDAKFYIKYDPEDMTLIYLYEKTPNGLRFVSEAITKVTPHRGKQEQEEWETQYFKDIDKLNDTARIKTRDKVDELLAAHGLLPEQNGLVSPSIKGIEKKKRKGKKEGEIGKVLKDESNITVIDSEYNEDFRNLY